MIDTKLGPKFYWPPLLRGPGFDLVVYHVTYYLCIDIEWSVEGAASIDATYTLSLMTI